MDWGSAGKGQAPWPKGVEGRKALVRLRKFGALTIASLDARAVVEWVASVPSRSSVISRGSGALKPLRQ